MASHIGRRKFLATLGGAVVHADPPYALDAGSLRSSAARRLRGRSQRGRNRIRRAVREAIRWATAARQRNPRRRAACKEKAPQ